MYTEPQSKALVLFSLGEGDVYTVYLRDSSSLACICSSVFVCWQSVGSNFVPDHEQNESYRRLSVMCVNVENTDLGLFVLSWLLLWGAFDWNESTGLYPYVRITVTYLVAKKIWLSIFVSGCDPSVFDLFIMEVIVCDKRRDVENTHNHTHLSTFGPRPGYMRVLPE